MKEPEINLNGWQTIKSFAKANGYQNTQFIYKLINQGKVAVRTIPELNDMKLVILTKPKNEDV